MDEEQEKVWLTTEEYDALMMDSRVTLETASRRERDYRALEVGVEILGSWSPEFTAQYEAALRRRMEELDDERPILRPSPPMTRGERVRAWWQAHRPRVHFGECRDE